MRPYRPMTIRPIFSSPWLMSKYTLCVISGSGLSSLAKMDVVNKQANRVMMDNNWNFIVADLVLFCSV